MNKALAYAAAVAVVVPQAASAQLPLSPPKGDSASQEGQGVTVTGRAKRVTTILKTVLRPSGIDQLGRYEVPVCPGISGAPKGTEHTLLRLIRENAAASKIRLDPPGCKPNALALFVTTPDALVVGLKKKAPGYFGLIAQPDFKRLSTGGAPIRSWHVVETAGRDGQMLDGFGGIGGELGASDAKVVKNAAATRVYENTRQEILLGFAVIDSNATVGKTVQQLADIISLHLFLDLGQDAATAAGPGSILSLFQPGATAPGGMTAFDKGLLTGTYALERNNYNSQFQRHRIARDIAKGEAAADPDPDKE